MDNLLIQFDVSESDQELTDGISTVNPVSGRFRNQNRTQPVSMISQMVNVKPISQNAPMQQQTAPMQQCNATNRINSATSSGTIFINIHVQYSRF